MTENRDGLNDRSVIPLVATSYPISVYRVIDDLQRTKLKGHGQREIYRDCDIDIIKMSTKDLVPCQNYVLKSKLLTVSSVYLQLMADCGRQPFSKDICTMVKIDHGGGDISNIPLLPPIVEEYTDEDGKKRLLISDGMHRCYLALRCSIKIPVFVVSGIDERYPYYAYPLDNGWDDVQEIDELVEGFERKRYREPEDYKALFRMYNDVFPGVQEKRENRKP